MSVRKVTRTVLAVSIAALGLAGTQLSPAAAAAPQQPAVRTVYYNADAAGVWKPNVKAAVEIWNTSVKNVRLVEGSPSTITVFAAGGWPYAQVNGLGRGRISLGEAAVDIGHDRTRITAHEFGHLLGLPDRRTGLCSDLMSGSSAPASCKNATPSAREAADVERNFGGGFAAAAAMVASYKHECYEHLDHAGHAPAHA
jgi:snapalysin